MRIPGWSCWVLLTRRRVWCCRREREFALAPERSGNGPLDALCGWETYTARFSGSPGISADSLVLRRNGGTADADPGIKRRAAPSASPRTQPDLPEP